VQIAIHRGVRIRRRDHRERLDVHGQNSEY
jgi:hypothetical protein